jgi:hypothetical protein
MRFFEKIFYPALQTGVDIHSFALRVEPPRFAGETDGGCKKSHRILP